MQKRGGIFAVFFLFFILSLIILFLFRQQILSFSVFPTDTATNPLQRSLFAAFSGLVPASSQMQKLQAENEHLRRQLVDQSELKKEAAALRDQFDRTEIPSKKLLPATVIGMSTFIPGVSLPETIVIDKGKQEGVKNGQAVIVNTTLVGGITTVSDHRAVVSLVSRRNQSFTAKTSKTNAVGILKGEGSGALLLQNVVLSDKLEKGDTVLTKGDVDEKGLGYPPDLTIGKITSIDKKRSNLFQTAEIATPLDFVRLSMVFVMVQ